MTYVCSIDVHIIYDRLGHRTVGPKSDAINGPPINISGRSGTSV